MYLVRYDDCIVLLGHDIPWAHAAAAAASTILQSMPSFHSLVCALVGALMRTKARWRIFDGREPKVSLHAADGNEAYDGCHP